MAFVPIRLPQLSEMHVVKHDGNERRWHPKPLSTHCCLTIARVTHYLGTEENCGLGRGEGHDPPSSSSAYYRVMFTKFLGCLPCWIPQKKQLCRRVKHMATSAISGLEQSAGKTNAPLHSNMYQRSCSAFHF